MSKVIVTFGKLSNIAYHVIDIVLRKNVDYADAWQTFGVFTPLVRLNDKLLRVKHLSESGTEALVADEKIEDTLRDIVGYGLLALLYLKENPGKQVDAKQLSFDDLGHEGYLPDGFPM